MAVAVLGFVGWLLHDCLLQVKFPPILIIAKTKGVACPPLPKQRGRTWCMRPWVGADGRPALSSTLGSGRRRACCIKGANLWINF